MRWKTLIAAILIGLAPSVARADAPKFELQRTPSGIEFWYASRPDLPKDALTAGWRDGVGFAVAGKEGLSFVGVRVLMRLASNSERDNITEALRDLGADANFSTTGWNTFAALNVPPRNLEAAAALAEGLFATPPPDEKLLDKIETGLGDFVGSEEKRAEIAVAWAARRLGQRALPLNVPRETPSSYRSITRDDVETWRRKVFARDNLFLAVEGPSSAEAFAAVIDKLLGPLPATSDVPPRPEFPFAARPQMIVIESPQAQTMIRETAGTDLTLGPDRLEFFVAMETLGGGFESRLWAEIRQTLGVSYNLEAGLSDERDHELMYLWRRSRQRKGGRGAVGDESGLRRLARKRRDGRRTRRGRQPGESQPRRSLSSSGHRVARGRRRSSHRIGGKFSLRLRRAASKPYGG